MHICVSGFVWLSLYLFVPVPFCCQDDRDAQNNCWSEIAMFMEMFCGMGLFFRHTTVSTIGTNPVFCFNASSLLRHFKFFFKSFSVFLKKKT